MPLIARELWLARPIGVDKLLPWQKNKPNNSRKSGSRYEYHFYKDWHTDPNAKTSLKCSWLGKGTTRAKGPLGCGKKSHSQSKKAVLVTLILGFYEVLFF